MPYELFGHQDPIYIRTVANMQQHIGNASCRRFLEGGKGTPNTVYLVLHLLLYFSNSISFEVGDVGIH
jgi:hypothetical protein